MKAAYFIAQAKNTERYNAFFEREGVFLTPFSASDIPSLTAFITRDKITPYKIAFEILNANTAPKTKGAKGNFSFLRNAP